MSASASRKSLLARGLLPLAKLTNALAGAGHRLWAFSRLRSLLPDIDPSVVVLGMPEIHGTAAISLGCNLYLYRDLHLETRENGRIEIGDDVVISRGVHLVAFAGITIGAGSMIGEYASLRDANHRFRGEANLRRSGHEATPISIGRNVWIGRGVTILPGVVVGDSAVIGANAVVTHNVPAGAVFGGVPARPLNRKAS